MKLELPLPSIYDTAKQEFLDIGRGERGCTLISARILTKIPMDVIYQAAKPYLNDRNGMSLSGIHNFWKSLGYKLIEIPYCGKTFKTFTAKEDCLVLVHNHIVAYLNGSIEDWAANRAFRIKRVWKISTIQQEDNYA